MKRGLIVWDESALPRSALEHRLERARDAARTEGVPAIVVYADVWRSNRARALVNFMPFWGRSLLVIPVDEPPVLLCGNSPRVYPWLSTVTFVEELRPTKDFGARLLELASERGWTRLGVLDRQKLPFDIDRTLADAALEVVDLEPWDDLITLDTTELAMRRGTVRKARELVERTVAELGPSTERDLVAGLEGALRRAGMEDVLIRISQGLSAPRLATADGVDETTSVFVACEDRGHWAQLMRPLQGLTVARQHFLEALKDLKATAGKRFDLAGPFPYRTMPPTRPLEPGQLFAFHLETRARTFYGDTCVARAPASAELV
jgi:hypothetical protein